MEERKITQNSLTRLAQRCVDLGMEEYEAELKNGFLHLRNAPSDQAQALLRYLQSEAPEKYPEIFSATLKRHYNAKGLQLSLSPEEQWHIQECFGKPSYLFTSRRMAKLDMAGKNKRKLLGSFRAEKVCRQIKHELQNYLRCRYQIDNWDTWLTLRIWLAKTRAFQANICPAGRYKSLYYRLLDFPLAEDYTDLLGLGTSYWGDLFEEEVPNAVEEMVRQIKRLFDYLIPSIYAGLEIEYEGEPS